MKIRALKFGLPLVIYLLAYCSFTQNGWMVFAPVLFAFFIVPSVELLIPSNEKNLSDAEEQIAKQDRLYDIWLYAIVPLQYIALYYFLQTIQLSSNNKWEMIRRIMVMVLLRGIFGINIHRANPNAISTLVEKWSAGCQVLNNPQEFAQLISMCEASGNKFFTYTLFNEWL